MAAAAAAGDVQRVPAHPCAAAGQCAGAAGGCGPVIGAALAGAAAGLGHRKIAERLGRPAATVRGWLRRFASRAGALRSAFTGLLREVDADPLMPGPAGSPLADAVAAVLAAAVAVARRWQPAVFMVSPWELAAAVTSARLLAGGTAADLTNTGCPW